MASGGAVKEVFAEIGATWDTSVLEAGEALVNRAVNAFQKLGLAADAAAASILQLVHPVTTLAELQDTVDKAKTELKEAQAASQAMAEALAKVEAEADGATKETKGLGNGADKAAPKVKSLGSELSSLVTRLAALAAGSQAIGWLVNLGQESDFTARRLGITAAEVATLRSVARSSGAEIQDVQDSIVTFGERMRDAVLDPKSDPAKQLAQLGIAVPASTDEIPDSMALLDQLADGLAGITNPAERAAAASTLLGDVGVRLLPSLEKGSRGIEEMRRRVRDLGGGFTGAGAESARKFSVAIDGLQTVLESMAARVIERLSKALDGLGVDFEKSAAYVFDLIDNSNILEVTLVTLAVVFGAMGLSAAAAWFAATWPAILAAAAIGAIVLVVEDLITGFEGGQSAIFDWIDSFAGVGAARQWILGVKFVLDAMWIVLQGIGSYITDALVPAFKALFTGDWDALGEISANSSKVISERSAAMERAMAAASAEVNAAPQVQGLYNSRNDLANTIAKIDQNSTTNVNITALPGLEQIEGAVRNIIAEENERAQRDLKDGLAEAGGS